MSQNPTTTNVTTPNQWWRGPVRLAIQLAMGGLLTFVATYVVQHYGPNLGATPIAIILAASTWLTSAAQHYGEQHGIIPIILPYAHPGTTAPKV